MKIGFLLLNTHSGRGGLEKVLIDITDGIKQYGVTSYVYSLYEPIYAEFKDHFENFECIDVSDKFKIKNRFMPKFLYKYLYKKATQKKAHILWNSIYEQKLDALIVLNLSKQFVNNYDSLRRLKKVSDIPFLSWTHSSLRDTSPATKKAVEKFIDIFDLHLAIGEGMQRELKEIYNLDNIKVTYNPIKKANFLKRQYNRFLYIGRIDKNKRLIELLNILKKLHGEWRLDIYGSTGDIEKDRVFQESILNDQQLNNNVDFHGWKLDPWAFIEEAGVLLLNSKTEGFSLVLAEAMMRGIPCVSANCPVGPAYIVKNGINGWLYDMDDEENCLHILQNILNTTIELPLQEDVCASVERFESEKVFLEFTNALKQAKKNYNSNKGV